MLEQLVFESMTDRFVVWRCWHEDIPIIYQMTGQAGIAFWLRLGYQAARVDVEPEFRKDDPLVWAIREQAAARGLDVRAIENRYTVR